MGRAHEKNAIFSAWVMRRIGASGSFAGVFGRVTRPLARMVAPSDGAGSGVTGGEGSTGSCAAIGSCAIAAGNEST